MPTPRFPSSSVAAVLACALTTLLGATPLRAQENEAETGYAPATGNETGSMQPRDHEIQDPEAIYQEQMKSFRSVVFGKQNGYLDVADWNHCRDPQERMHGPWKLHDTEGEEIRGYSPQLHPTEEKVVYVGPSQFQPLDTYDLYLATRAPHADPEHHVYEVTNLTLTPELTEGHPAWSPTGEFIAYAVKRGDHNEAGIWVMRADDIHDRTRLAGFWDWQVEGDYSTGEAANLAWSPDGQRIVFTMKMPPSFPVAHGPATHDLFVVELATGQVRRLTDTPFVDELFPAWHPYQDMIAYERRDLGYVRTHDEGSAEGVDLPYYEKLGPTRGHVWLVWGELWHAQVTPEFPAGYTSVVGLHQNPQFTPSGHQLLFHSDRLGSRQMLRMNIAGGPIEVVSQPSLFQGWPVQKVDINWDFSNYGEGCTSIMGSGGSSANSLPMQQAP